MYVYGRNVAKELLKNKKVIKKAYLMNGFKEDEILNLLNVNNICIEYLDKRQLDKLEDGNHQGIILQIEDYKYLNLNDMLNSLPENPFIVILDHLEDPHNFGAIIRTCEAAGVHYIVIPKDRSVSINSTVMKTSVGALYNVKICQVVNLNQTIKKLKSLGYWIIGTDMNGSNYQEFNYPEKTALVIGSEGFGMSRLVKEACDYVVSIPMNGKINSLNASVAAGIMIYELIRKR